MGPSVQVGVEKSNRMSNRTSSRRVGWGWDVLRKSGRVAGGGVRRRGLRVLRVSKRVWSDTGHRVPDQCSQRKYGLNPL